VHVDSLMVYRVLKAALVEILVVVRPDTGVELVESSFHIKFNFRWEKIAIIL